MRKALTAFMMLFALALTIEAQSSGEWIRYISAEGRYNVAVPQEPKLSTQETTASTGEKIPQQLAASPDGNGVFMIGYFDYATPMTFSLDKARDGMLSTMRATLLGEETISLGTSSGRALKLLAKAPDDSEFLVRARYYDVGRRVYVLQCIFPKSEDSPAITEKCLRFLDSFKSESLP
jgi:hypothetical protein